MARAEIKGWATTSDLDIVRHSVAPGAFAESIAKAGLIGPRGIKLLLDHAASKPAGRITKLDQRGNGLWIEAELDLDISYAADRWAAIKAAGGLNFSVGFYPIDYEIAKDARGNEYINITKGELFEVSVVTLPANLSATMVFDTKSGGMSSALSRLVSETARLRQLVERRL